LQQAVDEIVIVDSGSQDNTLAICRLYTDRICRAEFNKDFSALRNHAARVAGNPWILALDADEYLSEELRLKIHQLCTTEKYWGYYIKRTNFYGDKIIKFGFPGIDSLVRLYRKDGSFFSGKIHEKVITQGLSKRTPLKIFHRQKSNNYTCQSFQSKWLKYIDIEAREKSKISKGKKLIYLLSSPLVFFFILCRDLFVLLGILDGCKGIKIAFLLAFYRYKLFVSIYKAND
jgi:glycosyltransferase involved in cell wall biosynthesis